MADNLRFVLEHLESGSASLDSAAEYLVGWQITLRLLGITSFREWKTFMPR
jgi:hypothetical protein